MSESHPLRGPNTDEPTFEHADTLSEQVYRLIRRDILTSALKPGDKLKVEALRTLYNMGPTPIREALERLATERLAQAEQRRGFRVAPMTMPDLVELTDMRVLLETEALRRSLAAGDFAWEGAIVSAFHKLDRLNALAVCGSMPNPDEWWRRNREFHNALIAAAGSDWLARSHAQVCDHFERYHRRLLDAVPAAERNRHKEHRAIMEAAIAHDSDRAIRLTRDHIERTAGLLQEALRTESGIASR
jgi:DNA-binding GntR family transcriptional regulator